MDITAIQARLKKFNLRHRPSQIEMITAVYDSLSKNKITCIEAPTGTGKTLSYLLAAYSAKSAKQKIIISTATIALQEQLIKNDLPLFEKIIGEKVKYAIAKGRQNYLCLAKLDQEDDLFNQSTLGNLKKEAENTFWDGDQENLTFPVSAQDWQTVTTDSAGCSGKHCDHYEKCYFFKARNKTYTAEIIVTNHSLLLSDLSLGGGTLLPEIENNLYVIDECHHLPQRAISHFSKATRLLSAIDWINAINFSVQRAISAKHLSDTWQPKINQLTRDLVTEIKAFRQLLESNQPDFNNDELRINEEDVIKFEPAKHLKQLAQELQVALASILSLLESELEQQKAKQADSHELIKQHSQIKFLQSKVADFYETWELFCHARQEKEAPIARWFQAISYDNQTDYVCHCSPINVSQKLCDHFWKRIENGALLCSATIRSLGSFDHFLKKTGLHTLKNLNTQAMPFIFNYKDSVIFVPEMQNEPSGMNQQAHRDEALTLLAELILPKSGTLVLFTSRAAMEETYHKLEPSLAFDVIMQGQKSKTQLIESHKNRIRSGKRSIIFGLASLAEGIDLPADFCQHVIIHKLPFAVPSTPVELTRSEWISQHNLNPFMLATLPETSVKLTQYIGRLIRQEEDKGIVSILDRRLYSKQYGKQLLKNLPGFTQLIKSPVTTLKKQASIAELYT